MRYQLVLQFHASSAADFENLVDLEEVLGQKISDIAEVDGHDFGQDEFNIFIFTDDPIRTFRLVEAVIEARRPVQQLTAAYRALDQEEYTVLWPPGRQSFSIS